MAYSKIAFYILAALAAIGAVVLLVWAHIDMAAMRTRRQAFNFDGIIAFLSAIIITGGLVVLFPLWRVLAYDTTRAAQDMKYWIGALWIVFIGLHIPFILSVFIDAWINAQGELTGWQAVRNSFGGTEIGLYMTLAWPLPVIYWFGIYRKNLEKNTPKKP